MRLWCFGIFFFLELHDDLDEGSQQRHETLLALNRLREIVQHPDNYCLDSSRGWRHCLWSHQIKLFWGQLRKHCLLSGLVFCGMHSFFQISSKFFSAIQSFYSRFFSILLTHEGSHREAYQDFQPSLTSSAAQPNFSRDIYFFWPRFEMCCFIF